MGGVTLLAGLYAGLFAAAAIGKVLAFEAWSSLAAAVGGRRRAATAALRAGLPAAEALVAGTIVVAPRIGLVAAAGLLAVLAAGIGMTAGRVGDRPCSCFGSLRARPLRRAAALRNLALSAGAAALVFVVAPGPLDGTGTALAIAGCALPVLAAARRRTARFVAAGDRVRDPALATGTPRLVVVLAPGCGPCTALAADVRSLDVKGVDVLAVVAAAGAPTERAALLDALGPRGRPELAGLVRRWRVPGTPFGVGVNAAGVVTAARPVRGSADLHALAGDALAGGVRPAAKARPAGIRPSRRQLLRTAAGVAAGAVTAAAMPRGAVAAAQALAGAVVPRRQGTPDVNFDQNPDNSFTGSCDDFGDRISGRGVIGADGQPKPGAGGYTHVAGFGSADTVAAGVCRRSDRVQREWRGYCPCDGQQYTDETLCAEDCPSGLRCFGEQCVETFRRVCVEAIVDVCVAQPVITVSVLRWKPSGRGVGKRCKAMAERFTKSVAAHELRHAQDVRDAVDETNALFANRTIRRCALEEAAARAAVDAEIAQLIDAAKRDAYSRDAAKSAAFHSTSAGRHGLLDCRVCAPRRRRRRSR